MATPHSSKRHQAAGGDKMKEFKVCHQTKATATYNVHKSSAVVHYESKAPNIWLSMFNIDGDGEDS